MKELIFPAVKMISANHGRIVVEYNAHHEIYVRMFEKMLSEKTNGYAQLKLRPPVKRRSTGYRSQNSRIHGHCLDISVQCKDPVLTAEQWKLYFKSLAIEQGFSFVEFRGIRVPVSLSDASSEEASMVIAEINKFADEKNYWLTEYDQNDQPYKSVGGRTRKEMEKYNEKLL